MQKHFEVVCICQQPVNLFLVRSEVLWAAAGMFSLVWYLICQRKMQARRVAHGCEWGHGLGMFMQLNSCTPYTPTLDTQMAYFWSNDPRYAKTIKSRHSFSTWLKNLTRGLALNICTWASILIPDVLFVQIFSHTPPCKSDLRTVFHPAPTFSTAINHKFSKSWAFQFKNFPFLQHSSPDPYIIVDCCF